MPQFSQGVCTSSRQTPRALAPKTQTSVAQRTEAEPQNPSRTSPRAACQHCRKRRTRCDGREPCFRCQKAAIECIYEKGQREKFADLLAENERLKRDNAAKDRLLQTLGFSHGNEIGNKIIDKLKDSNKARQDILQVMDRTQNMSNSFRVRNRQEQVAPIGLDNLDIGPTTCPFCSCRLRPWNFSRNDSDVSRTADATAMLSAEGLPTPVSLPLLFGNRDAAKSQADTWMTLGLERAYVRGLFTVLVTWDCLPFCVICEAPFLKAYDTGSSQFCSSALVNALTALAIRVIIETENETGPPPTSCLGSQQFFDNAKGILGNGRKPAHLPDIQALGILSIYQISCGRETEAQTLAQLFLSSITDLYNRRPLAEEENKEYILVLTTTYCGAVSLVRLLRLACSLDPNMSSPVYEQDSISLDQSPCSMASGDEYTADLGSGTGAHSSKLSGIQLIGGKIFRLTEWVYEIRSALETTPTGVALNNLALVYTRCLAWYDDFFHLRANTINTPSILFIHMYYQFFLLVLFRPFVRLVPDNSLIRPSEICAQSAQSILSLAQSYDNLFTLRRISGFAPYFVLAAGLYSRDMEDSGSPIDSTPARLSDVSVPALATDSSGTEAMYGQRSLSPSSRLEMSAVGSARHLLDKMKSDHLAVAMAKKILKDPVEDQNP